MKKIVIIGGDPNSVNSDLSIKFGKIQKKIRNKFIWSQLQILTNSLEN